MHVLICWHESCELIGKYVFIDITFQLMHGWKKHICIHIGSAGLYIYFCIRATVKLFEKNGCYILFSYKSTSSIELRY